MSENTEMLSSRVPQELKDLVDADSRSNQEVVRAALWREFGGQRAGELKVRIEEKEKRIDQVEEERSQRTSELEELRKELSALRSKYDEKKEEEQETLQEAKDALTDVPRDPDNPAIENWADKIGIEPSELIAELEDMDE